MYLRLLKITILFTVVCAGDVADPNFSISFTRDESRLVDCIGNQVHHFGNFLGYTFVDAEIAELMGKFVGGKVFGKTLTKNQFRNSVVSLKTELPKKSSKLSGDKLLGKRLSILITNALRMCSDDELDKSSSSKLPEFTGESPDIAAFLNYVLVTWPMDLKYMIRNKNYYALLMKYADEAIKILKRVLDSTPNVDDFRRLMRMFWMSRAQQYFDGRDPNFPYIVHLYTAGNPSPHTYEGDIEGKFSNRSGQSFEDRNPLVPFRTALNVLAIHSADRNGIAGEFDPYQLTAMTSSEYHLEIYLIKFYRIIFYALELRIWNSEEKLPERVQDILYNDLEYRLYLLNRRSEESSLDSEDPIRKSLGRRARVCEEELALLMMMNTPTVSGVTLRPKNTTSSSTTGNVWSTTERPIKRKKGSEGANVQGKHLSKQPKPASSDSCSGDGKSDSSGTKKAADSCIQNQFSYFLTNLTTNEEFVEFSFHELFETETKAKYYGYITHHEGSVSQLSFSREEFKIFLKNILLNQMTDFFELIGQSF